MPSPHLFVERIMAAVNHTANVLSQAQGVKPDSNVEYSLNPSALIEYDSFTKAMDSGKCFTARLRSGRASEGLKSIMQKA